MLYPLRTGPGASRVVSLFAAHRFHGKTEVIGSQTNQGNAQIAKIGFVHSALANIGRNEHCLFVNIDSDITCRLWQVLVNRLYLVSGLSGFEQV